MVLVKSVYHYRRVVPAELRPAFGQGEVWRSLHTSDRTRAEKRRDRMDKAVAAVWSRLREEATLNPEPACYAPQFIAGDFFAHAAAIPDNSVDLIVTDPPFAVEGHSYKLTGHLWDKPVDLARLWTELHRIATPEAVFIFFSVQPFLTDLINSNRSEFGWTEVWIKSNKTRVRSVEYRPLREHEDIAIFIPSSYPRRYHYQPPHRKRRGIEGSIERKASDSALYDQPSRDHTYERQFERVTSVHRVPNDLASIHPTQKPVALLRKLVETFSAPGAMVLDPFAGSGSLAIACLESGRRSLSYEADVGYATKAQARIDEFVTESTRLQSLPFEYSVGRSRQRKTPANDRGSSSTD